MQALMQITMGMYGPLAAQLPHPPALLQGSTWIGDGVECAHAYNNNILFYSANIQFDKNLFSTLSRKCMCSRT